MTTAQQISARFGDDGTTWRDADGVGLEDACEAAGGTCVVYEPGVRWTFDDGSAICWAGDAWDLGIAGCDCCCWAGAGHVDGCPAGDDR